MIRPTDIDDTWGGRWQRLHQQLSETEDPAERDVILGELDELEHEAGEAYIERLTAKRDAQR